MTKPTKADRPATKIEGVKMFEQAGGADKAGGLPMTQELGGGPCVKKAAPKSEVVDQIGLHLRSVYDDILAQPVPGRFLELLRQLESASEARSSKDSM